MALTANIRARTMWEDFYVRLVEVAFDASYPTGGEALTDANCGLADDGYYVFPFPRNGYTFQLDQSGQKLLAYWGDNNNASDGPGVQVADTTDLSALTGVLLLAIGKAPA